MNSEEMIENYAHLKPIKNKVLILPDPKVTKVGNILVPDSAQKKTRKGLVVAVGPACCNLVVGNRVAYGEFSGLTYENEVGKDGAPRDLYSMWEEEVGHVDSSEYQEIY